MKIGEEFMRIADALKNGALSADAETFVVVDRLAVQSDKETLSRLADSVETAFFEGKNSCVVEVQTEEGRHQQLFSKSFEADGIIFEEPSEQMFSFNSPVGACPRCEGFGKVIGIDENLVIPDKQLSVYEGAVVCWRGEVMGEWKNQVVAGARKAGFPIHHPYINLTKEEKKMLWEGCQYFEGIDAFFRFLETNQYKIQYRVMLARYRGKTVCPECHGTRLKKEAQWVKIGGKSITELVELPMYSQFESDVFAKMKDDSFDSSINQIRQCFDGKDLYPTIEDKAASLLYFITKNHSFVDGNKRIAAACFLYFLEQNNSLLNSDNTPIIDNATLAALTLFVATSKPEEKEIVKKLIISILNRNKQ